MARYRRWHLEKRQKWRMFVRILEALDILLTPYSREVRGSGSVHTSSLHANQRLKNEGELR